ncbi:hypothetical protein QBK99_05255 [Corticibacterium sp. UT-5YL-CI-8]|nr:hypothetical protein [Tianweitania sp. UT-5YL-CI-8]
MAHISCGLCNLRRNYLAGDLLKMLGDVSIFDVERHMRCTQCGRKDYMTVKFDLPPPGDRVKMKFRRLVEIKMVRKFIWRDD